MPGAQVLTVVALGHQAPAGQTEQPVEPLPSAICPAGQAWQVAALPAPVVKEYVPGAQAEIALPPGQYEPAGQVWQVLALVAPMAVEYVPAAQVDIALPPLQYAPEGQVWQVLALVAPGVVEYVPGAQVLTVVALGHHAPTGQTKQLLEPLLRLTCPAGQLLQVDAPGTE